MTMRNSNSINIWIDMLTRTSLSVLLIGLIWSLLNPHQTGLVGPYILSGVAVTIVLSLSLLTIGYPSDYDWSADYSTLPKLIVFLLKGVTVLASVAIGIMTLLALFTQPDALGSISRRVGWFIVSMLGAGYTWLFFRESDLPFVFLLTWLWLGIAALLFVRGLVAFFYTLWKLSKSS